MPDELPENDEQSASNRPFWSGTITFGLVSVPVNLFPANRGSRVSLHMYGPSGVRLRRRYYSADSGSNLENDEIVRGYEVERGKYVVVSDDELERVAPEKSRDIDLRRFVPYADIPKLYFERGYFLAPAGGSPKAYRLLAETMAKHGKAGIATFVMRGKEYLVAIVAENGLLRAETLRFFDEIRSPQDVGLPARPRLSRQSIRQFEELVKKEAADELPQEKLKDAESQRLLQLIRRKQEKGKDTVRGKRKEGSAPVIDLLEVLRQALAKSGKSAQRRNEEEDTREDELAGLSKADLYKKATTLRVPGRSSMTKEQLMKAIHAQGNKDAA